MFLSGPLFPARLRPEGTRVDWFESGLLFLLLNEWLRSDFFLVLLLGGSFSASGPVIAFCLLPSLAMFRDLFHDMFVSRYVCSLVRTWTGTGQNQNQNQFFPCGR